MSETARPSPLVLAGLALLLALHALALRTYFVPVLASPDANCYHVAARLLESSGELHRHTSDPLAYVGWLWLETEPGTFYPKYPPVYTLIAAAAERLFGPPAGLYVGPVCAWLAVPLAFVAGLALLPGWAALAVAACVATGPVFSSFSIDQIAHAPSVALLSAAFACLLHGLCAVERGAAGSRVAHFASAGLLLGLASGVRYTNVLLALPALVWFAGRRLDRAQLRRLAAFGLGFALPCLGLAGYHLQAFGSPWRTAYALTAEQTAFSLDNVGRHLPRYARAWFDLALGPAGVAALVGFGLVAARDLRRALFFAAWGLPLVLLYAAYYFAPPNHALSFIRFLMPLQLPAALLAGVLLAHLAERTRGGARLGSILGLVAIQATWALPGVVRQFELRYRFNDMLARRIDFIEQHVPPGSTVLATRWLLDDLDYRLDPSRTSERRLYINDLIDQARVEAIVVGRASIQDERLGRVRELLLDVPPQAHRRRLGELFDAAPATGREAFLVGAPEIEAVFLDNFGPRYRLERVATQAAPRPNHRLRALPRNAALGANPAWGELAVSRIVTGP